MLRLTPWGSGSLTQSRKIALVSTAFALLLESIIDGVADGVTVMAIAAFGEWPLSAIFTQSPSISAISTPSTITFLGSCFSAPAMPGEYVRCVVGIYMSG